MAAFHVEASGRSWLIFSTSEEPSLALETWAAWKGKSGEFRRPDGPLLAGFSVLFIIRLSSDLDQCRSQPSSSNRAHKLHTFLVKTLTVVSASNTKDPRFLDGTASRRRQLPSENNFCPAEKLLIRQSHTSRYCFNQLRSPAILSIFLGLRPFI